MRPLFLLLAITAGSLGWTPSVCEASDGSTTADAETTKAKGLRLFCTFSFAFKDTSNPSNDIVLSPDAKLMAETPISSTLSRCTASATQLDPSWFQISNPAHSVTVSWTIATQGAPPPPG